MSFSMWSLMKDWILKHSTLMPICIAAAFAIISIIIVLFSIYKILCKTPVCDISSPNNTFAMPRLAIQVVAQPEQGLIVYSVEELNEAANNLGESNLIGSGTFGPVYIGFLRGTLVAIRRLVGSIHPTRFLAEVTHLSEIRHYNVVNLLGYCCENEQQMLVYEYLVNGNVRDYLRGSIDLEFEKRISIALGAAKGLLHLHSLTPPLKDTRFKTAKVLLDADFNAKVSDAGLSRLLEMRNEEASDDHDQEVGFHNEDETSDVYSFGLFLVELITGEERGVSELLQWLVPGIGTVTLVDQRMNGTFTREEMESVKDLILKCLKSPVLRWPNMETVVTELQKIHQSGFTFPCAGLRREPFE